MIEERKDISPEETKTTIEAWAKTASMEQLADALADIIMGERNLLLYGRSELKLPPPPCCGPNGCTPRTPIIGEHQAAGPCKHPSSYRGAQGVRICELCGASVK